MSDVGFGTGLFEGMGACDQLFDFAALAEQKTAEHRTALAEAEADAQPLPPVSGSPRSSVATTYRAGSTGR
jgi:hypothetical protein